MPAAELDHRTMTVNGTPAWCAWLDNLARHMRTSRAAVIDQAAVQLAKSSGFDQPPPPRLPDLRAAR